MIARQQMFEPLVEACPTFAPSWERFRVEWKDEPGDPPLYVALGDLAHHLIERFRTGMTEDFPAVFQVVERWHCEGDEYVREAATVGLLEGIQNTAGQKGIDPAAFERWLLPQSRKWWDKLNRFWDGDTSALREE